MLPGAVDPRTGKRLFWFTNYKKSEVEIGRDLDLHEESGLVCLAWRVGLQPNKTLYGFSSAADERTSHAALFGIPDVFVQLKLHAHRRGQAVGEDPFGERAVIQLAEDGR